MPGPKMGPRPADFDEDVIRQSPTFVKWLTLQTGEKLRYACREFVKGSGEDEERLMRRIMIARRNNLRDHEVLKQARKQIQHVDVTTSTTSKTSLPTTRENLDHDSTMMQDVPESFVVLDTNGAVSASGNFSNAAASASSAKTSSVATRSGGRRPVSTVSDQQVEKEMDVAAVEATRSYRAWLELKDGCEMIYNQKYIKGQVGHDWLLRKNIWRRMRYRRDCKRMVEGLRTGGGSTGIAHPGAPVETQSHSTRLIHSAPKRKARSQSKKQRKDDRSPRPQQPPSLAMNAIMDGSQGTVEDLHESVTLDQLLDESSSKIVERVKVGLLDATSIMTTEGSDDGGAHIMMATDEDSMRHDHHHPMHDENEEAAMAAAVAAANQEAIEAAVAAAESFGKSAHILSSSMVTVHDQHHHGQNSMVGRDHDHPHHHDHPLDTAALDAAAKLAAATALGQDGDDAVAAATAAAVAASTEDLYKDDINMV